MKKALNISALYIGLVIGAGFASGREILEYFNLKNQRDLSGIILAAVLFSFIAYIILIRAKENSTSDFYEFVSQTSGKFGYYIRKFMFLYMFTSFFVMLSAGGSLISLSLGIEKKFAIALMSLFCFFVLIFGTKGIEILNGILVPFMICGIIILCVFSVIGKTAPTVNLISEAKNNFLISALCYASYNTINAGAVLVPASEGASKKEIVLSSAISGGTLGILIFAVWITLNLYFNEVISSDFPLLDIAFLSGSIFKSAYSAAQSLFSAFNSQIFLDFNSIVIFFAQALHKQKAFFKSFAVNVIKSNVKPAQVFCQHAITKHIFGKNRAACAHKCYFHKKSSVSVILFTVIIQPKD